ncbi:DUF1292 domain-containing protein [Clostridium folliculivorans]|jgi:uncharacterized protein YrzB (UPF0473 family)|uniref:UPF0473 protein CFOLD11_21360 n=1 Tax=Clostridium folliculivorans TaxID=2886038 RepID=A0A9W5Y2F3_9CLOT|nr:DUF1292 domain-containing protein [Clostridium folliculivorans]GKU25310.1 UPF0473 protein [Clostridium folliculivorans]GKU28331.1 UPF0473 protein [Clostridium folliculivorans]
MENNIDTIVLLDEDGIETEFEVITKLDIEENEYVIVVPVDGSEDDAIALKIVTDEEGNDALITVEDEEEFAMVAEAYETLFADDLN